MHIVSIVSSVSARKLKYPSSAWLGSEASQHGLARAGKFQLELISTVSPSSLSRKCQFTNFSFGCMLYKTEFLIIVYFPRLYFPHWNISYPFHFFGGLKITFFQKVWCIFLIAQKMCRKPSWIKYFEIALCLESANSNCTAVSKGGKIQNTKIRIECSTCFGQWK